MKNIFVYLIFLLLSFCSAASVTPWIDFTLKNGHLTIPIEIEGIKTYAILDSGAQMNAINKAFVNKHKLTLPKGKKLLVSGVFGTEKRYTYNNVSTNILGYETELDGLAELTLGHHSNGLLLGAGFFRQAVMQIDYPNSKVRLISRNSVDVKKFANIKIDKQKDTGMPIVKVGFENDKSTWLILDTGNSGGLVLDRSLAKGMGWLDKLDVSSNLSMGVNNVAVTENFQIPLLKFGPFELESVMVSVPSEGTKSNIVSQYQKPMSRLKGRKVHGLLGYDVLKHFLLTIDYKRGFAHVGLPE